MVNLLKIAITSRLSNEAVVLEQFILDNVQW